MQGVSVVRDDGMRGAVVADKKPGQLVVEFSDGSRVVVPPEALVPQRDGTFSLSRGKIDREDTAEPEEVVIPVIAEELTVEKQRVARGKVRVNKRIETREEIVDTPVIHEEVVVDRIPINKFVDEVTAEVRDEDGVLIIPLVEEVLVVEKRLLVREEIRVSKRRTTTSTPQTVVLRREVVDIEREELNDPEPPEKNTRDG